MACGENGYINPRLGFPETGYSEVRSYCFWHKTMNFQKYALNVVCRPANIHEVYFAVIDDFGDLVVTR